MSKVRSQSLQIQSFSSMIVQPCMFRGFVICLLWVLGRKKRGEKLLTILIQTFSQEKKKEPTLKQSNDYLNVIDHTSNISTAKRKQ